MSLSAQTSREQRPYLRVEAHNRPIIPNVKELWGYREMLFFLVARDIKVRYRQTMLGAGWAVVQPLTSMLVFTIVFGGFAKVSSNGIPYPLFAFAAVVPWTFFSNVVSGGSESLVAQSHLVRKVYFPRIFVPISRIMSTFVDFVIAFSMLIMMLLYFSLAGRSPQLIMDQLLTGQIVYTNSFSTSPAAIIVLPLLVVYTMLIGLGLILWLSAMYVRYRDVRYLVPFGIQILTYLSPVAYPSGLVPANFQTLYSMNPMVTVIEGFRWVLLGQQAPSIAGIVPGIILTIVLLITGMLFFTHVERTFADIV